jgi:hypothetical protein
MATDDDVQFLLSDTVVQTEQPTSGVLTHQQPPPPSYSQINPQTIPAPHQNPTGPHVNSPMNGPHLMGANTMNISDYLVWSIFNILCCIWPLGLVATVISVITKRKKKNGDLQGARCTSAWAAAINILATLGGIILIILVSLHQNGTINIG